MQSGLATVGSGLAKVGIGLAMVLVAALFAMAIFVVVLVGIEAVGSFQ